MFQFENNSSHFLIGHQHTGYKLSSWGIVTLAMTMTKTLAVALIGAACFVGLSQNKVALAETAGTETTLENKPGTTSGYRLGTSDKIRLRVFEWRPARDEVFEWKSMNEDYRVGPSGKIALPLIGELQASGATTAELAQLIAGRLKQRIGLVKAPDITLEIVQFRPFYILGHLDKPGEYDYRPNLTVLQAVSLAGGPPRRDQNALRLDREAIAGTGDVELLSTTMVGLIAQKARLEAELAQAPQISFPATLQRLSTLDADQTMGQETAIFNARNLEFAGQAANMESLRTMLANEVDSLEKRIATHSKETKLTSKELSEIADLTQRGLATQPRKLAVQRNVYQLDGSRIQLDRDLIRARQDVVKNEQALDTLKTNRTNDLTTQLRANQGQILETTRKLHTAKELLSETGAELPGAHPECGKAAMKYTIIRQTADGILELNATETTAVEPSDTVKVERTRGSVEDLRLASQMSLDDTITSTLVRKVKR